MTQRPSPTLPMSVLVRPTVLALAIVALPFAGGAQERTPPAPERPAERPAERADRAPTERNQPSRGARERADAVRPESSARQPDVPADMMPPAGKCRIWMQGVSPAQQPAPTDCKTALRQRTSNGVVVFGPTEKRPLAVPGFRSQPRPARVDSASRTPPERTRPERNTDAAKEAAPRRVPTPAPRRNSTPATSRRPELPSEGRPF